MYRRLRFALDALPGLQFMAATQSSQVSGNGAGSTNEVMVIILDTGVSNPDVNVAFQIDVTTLSYQVWDDDGHGTHIAGIAAGMQHITRANALGVPPGTTTRTIWVANF